MRASGSTPARNLWALCAFPLFPSALSSCQVFCILFPIWFSFLLLFPLLFSSYPAFSVFLPLLYLLYHSGFVAFELQPFRATLMDKKKKNKLKNPSSPSLFSTSPHPPGKKKSTNILQEQKVKDKQTEIVVWPDSSKWQILIALTHNGNWTHNYTITLHWWGSSLLPPRNSTLPPPRSLFPLVPSYWDQQSCNGTNKPKCWSKTWSSLKSNLTKKDTYFQAYPILTMVQI